MTCRLSARQTTHTLLGTMQNMDQKKKKRNGQFPRTLLTYLPTYLVTRNCPFRLQGRYVVSHLVRTRGCFTLAFLFFVFIFRHCFFGHKQAELLVCIHSKCPDNYLLLPPPHPLCSGTYRPHPLSVIRYPRQYNIRALGR